MRTLLMTLLLLVSLALVACGGGDPQDDPDACTLAPPVANTPASGQVARPTEPERCTAT